MWKKSLTRQKFIIFMFMTGKQLLSDTQYL